MIDDGCRIQVASCRLVGSVMIKVREPCLQGFVVFRPVIQGDREATPKCLRIPLVSGICIGTYQYLYYTYSNISELFIRV